MSSFEHLPTLSCAAWYTLPLPLNMSADKLSSVNSKLVEPKILKSQNPHFTCQKFQSSIRYKIDIHPPMCNCRNYLSSKMIVCTFRGRKSQLARILAGTTIVSFQ